MNKVLSLALASALVAALPTLSYAEPPRTGGSETSTGHPGKGGTPGHGASEYAPGQRQTEPGQASEINPGHGGTPPGQKMKQTTGVTTHRKTGTTGSH